MDGHGLLRLGLVVHRQEARRQRHLLLQVGVVGALLFAAQTAAAGGHLGFLTEATKEVSEGCLAEREHGVWFGKCAQVCLVGCSYFFWLSKGERLSTVIEGQ